MVNNLGDHGDGSLPWAVAQANSDADPAGAIVRFDPTLFATRQTITLASTLTISGGGWFRPIEILGPGRDLLTISGRGAVRVFEVNSGVTASLEGVTISQGFADSDGGGILNRGETSIRDCTISSNYATSAGGGIANDHGTITFTGCDISGNSTSGAAGGLLNSGGLTLLTNSRVHGNYAPQWGGGILNHYGEMQYDVGRMIVQDCTVDQNSTRIRGGGIYNDSVLTIIGSTVAYDSTGGVYNPSDTGGGGIFNVGTMKLANSTVAYNTTEGSGGGIASVGGTLTVNNSTIAFNAFIPSPAGNYGGGGLYVPAGQAVLNNTIVALNRPSDSTTAPGVLSGAYNLIDVADPGLADLADNGGPTQTIALVLGSPAINAGSNDLAIDPASGKPLTTDQRGSGHDRIRGGVVDIGAFEGLTAVPLIVMSQPPATVSAGQGFGLTVAVMADSGNIDSTYNGTVTVALQDNPGGDSLGGTLTVSAVNGVATFSGLTLDKAATGYTLVVTASSVGQVSTHTLDVVPGDFSQWAVYWVGPSLANVPFSLQVTAVDQFGNVLAYHGQVAIELVDNPGGLGGNTTASAYGREANFYNLTISTAGVYTFKISGRGMVSETLPFSISIRTTVVSSVSVAWGSARSAMLETDADGLRLLPNGRHTDAPWQGIRQLVVNLADPADLTSGDITVIGSDGVDYGATVQSGSGTSYTIMLGRAIEGPDRVMISISSPVIISFTRRLDVLPGDMNDDGIVNSQDAVLIRNQIISYLGAMPTLFGDINGDGVVDLTDYTVTRNRLGTHLP
jgi:hypothetical protein